MRTVRHLLWTLILSLVACTAFGSPTEIVPPDEPLLPQYASDLEDYAGGTRYEIELALDLDAARVVGQQVINYVNAKEQPLGELYLRLYPATPGYGGSMTVTNILLEGEPLDPIAELEGTALLLPLETALQPGQEVTLSMLFTATVPTGNTRGYEQLVYMNGVMTLPNIYPLIPVYDDEGWNVELAEVYGDAVYSDSAFYRVGVTAPSELTFVASGSCTNPQPGEWECVAAPARDFMLLVGQEYDRASRLVEGVVVNSYYYSGHEELGVEALDVAADALEVFTTLFGPYPYAELDVVETPTSAGGIEYPGLVVIAERLYESGGRLEWVVAHEVAHQWWYAVVGNDQVDEPWLDEALTQYTTLLYFEEVDGRGSAENLMGQYFTQIHAGMRIRGEDMPVGLPVSAYPPDMYSPVVYSKGPLYFHALRERLGDETFFTFLQAYYTRHRYRIATADSLLTTLQMVSGSEQRDLFEEWVLGTANQ
jgi:hypothetical protein